jgi:membrane-bound lytic murein transglycosylase B
VFFLLLPRSATANWSPLIDRLVADHFDETAVRNLFSRPEVQFDPVPMVTKIKTLLRTRGVAPAETPNLKNRAVYKGYLKPSVIKAARAYYTENRAILQKIRKKYCIPEEIVVSILMVETNLGRNMGGRRAFNVLASMARCTNLDLVRDHLKGDLAFPNDEAYAERRCREKADWAYHELKSLIRYAAINNTDPLSIPGSIYGAIGFCQFMPSNVFLYGVDGDENGHIDLFYPDDALYSVGNYLRQNGWKCRMDRVSRHKVILTYNRSQIYANTVLAVADRLQGNIRTPKKQRVRAKQEG